MNQRPALRRLAFVGAAALVAATLSPAPAQALPVFTQSEVDAYSDVHDDSGACWSNDSSAPSQDNVQIVENGPATTVSTNAAGTVTDGATDTQARRREPHGERPRVLGRWQYHEPGADRLRLGRGQQHRGYLDVRDPCLLRRGDGLHLHGDDAGVPDLHPQGPRTGSPTPSTSRPTCPTTTRTTVPTVRVCCWTGPMSCTSRRVSTTATSTPR